MGPESESDGPFLQAESTLKGALSRKKMGFGGCWAPGGPHLGPWQSACWGPCIRKQKISDLEWWVLILPEQWLLLQGKILTLHFV